jgi:hypothetical protein
MNWNEKFEDKILPTVVLPAPAIPIREIEFFIDLLYMKKGKNFL